MFRCEICRKIAPPFTSATRIVLQTRAVEYPFRKEAYTRRVNGRLKTFDDLGGRGTTIVKEISVCPECARQYHEKQV